MITCVGLARWVREEEDIVYECSYINLFICMLALRYYGAEVYDISMPFNPVPSLTAKLPRI
jgi:hypothetical protein